MYIEIKDKTVKIYGETAQVASRNAIEFFNVFIGEDNWLEFGPACMFQLYTPGKEWFVPIQIKDFAAIALKTPIV